MIEVIRIGSETTTDTIERTPISASSASLEAAIHLMDCREEARNYHAFGLLAEETADEREIDYRFHIYGVLRMSKRDMQKFNDRLNNGGAKDYNKRNRRYFYRTAL